jgi:Domain of unknown function (DUF6438)
MRLRRPFVALIVLCCICVLARSQESRPPESGAESRGVPFMLRKSGQPELLVRLERGACPWSCPSYKLEVFDDGSVQFEGYSSVAVNGAVASKLDTDRCNKLLQAFLDTRFFDLEDAYSKLDISDDPKVTLTLRLNGREKQTRHCHGDFFAPRSLSALEDTVDRIVGSDIWVLTPTAKKQLEAQKKREAELSTRGETLPTELDFFDQRARQFGVGVIADVAAPHASVTIRLDGKHEIEIGTRLLVLRDRLYRARVRVVAVEGATARAAIEHCEPGVVVIVGDLIWQREP